MENFGLVFTTFLTRQKRCKNMTKPLQIKKTLNFQGFNKHIGALMVLVKQPLKATIYR